MIVVTGGAGFIGSNIVRALNARGREDIIVVDDLTDGHQFQNLADCEIVDYIDKDDFRESFLFNDDMEDFIDVVFHEGACSATTEWDGRYMMENNYEYSKALLHFCLERKIPYIYASSAAVYGGSDTFVELREHEKPLNVYGYSKFQFDQYVRKLKNELKSQVIGLRYFNVYGPREQHKGSMASVALHLYQQLKSGKETVKLFEGTDGFADGDQRRDFVYINDVVDVNLWLWENKAASGIYNVGTGRSQPFNDVANAVISWFKKGKIEYIPFPDHLKGCYQSFTEANISALRSVGYDAPFKTVEEGVHDYLDQLERGN